MQAIRRQIVPDEICKFVQEVTQTIYRVSCQFNDFVIPYGCVQEDLLLVVLVWLATFFEETLMLVIRVSVRLVVLLLIPLVNVDGDYHSTGGQL